MKMSNRLRTHTRDKDAPLSQGLGSRNRMQITSDSATFYCLFTSSSMSASSSWKSATNAGV